MNKAVQDYAKDKNVKTAAKNKDDTKATLKTMQQKATQLKQSIKTASDNLTTANLDTLTRLVVVSKSEYVSAYGPILKEMNKDIEAAKKLLKKVEQVASGMVQDFDKLVK